ncbi:MepB family protein [Streptomyces gilvosporeus]|uniref:MepB domain containing protein n=1 Tax=Streptomyces gilvosporeus TaxID=553510 RepID=A0A1V0TSG4_9ACTN|nr:MepB family protein [Streptomyces gilvosporeus]ARF55857.1 MepB domain containing protein [Streptomyces gilvosporeus]
MTREAGNTAQDRPRTAVGSTPWRPSAPVHGELLAAKTSVYDPAGLDCSQPVPEAESAEYGAHSFTVDGRAVRFRVAKTTPTKTGQFVTVWKRRDGGPIEPYGIEDPVDLFVISTREGEHFGQFVFPCEVLAARDIVSRNGSGGKRGFRVYPPWAVTTSRQARATQKWQIEHFLPVPVPGPADPAHARRLYQA